MARTCQTARKSIGYKSYREYETSQESLFRLYENDKTRCIAVNGSDDLKIQPDLVKLFFDISEKSKDVTDAIECTMQKLGTARDRIVALGIPNESIFSDSIAVNDVNDADSDSEAMYGPDEDDDYGKNNNDPVHRATVVCRVQLEGETVSLFGKVMFAMSSLGVQCHHAPLYEITELTAHRNQSRENAIRNAAEKAGRMINALNNDSLQLGKPISVIDTHVDVDDDANESFAMNFFSYWWRSRPRSGSKVNKRKRTQLSRSSEPKSTTEAVNRHELSGEAQARINELFVVPPIIVRSFVQIVFEIEEK